MCRLQGTKGSNPVPSQDEHFGLLRAASTISRRLRRRLVCDESGQELVEFALSASLTLCLLFAVIEFGYALYSYQFVNEVARDLTRYAIVRGSQCAFGMPNCNIGSNTLQTYAQQTYRYPGFDTTKLEVAATWYCPSTVAAKNPTWTPNSTQAACPLVGANSIAFNAPGAMIQVQVRYPFLLSIPFWSATTLWVKSTSSMVISQ